jgi:2-polyprenyl-3-methyl-5-hydroxy-6-metoxy-1,4-benzoquinol methylase
MATSTPDLEDRIDRERVAHEENDVLAESYRLKDRFRQVFEAPHIRRLDSAWDAALRHVANLEVLDYGCGRGTLGLGLAARGARVTGVDISEKYISEANQAARANGLTADQACFHAGDGHRTGLPDDAFDLVVGEGILHHLDLARASAEIFRVLRPGGVALFKEPLIGAPWMRLFRRLTPRARTIDERPFHESDLRRLGTLFEARSTYYGVLVPAVAGALALVTPNAHFVGLLTALDGLDRVLGRIQSTRSWHQYVLLLLVKSDPSAAARVEG